MRTLVKFLCGTLFILANFCWATPPATAPNLGYKTLTAKDIPTNLKQPAAGTVLVYDFFSYGCPHCYALSPFLEKWKKDNAAKIITPNAHIFPNNSAQKKSAYIIFQPVPVAFEEGWDIYSKAYHIADMLNIEPQLHTKIFDTAQNALLGINSDAQLRSFFLNNGVSAAQYDAIIKNPILQQKLATDKELLKDFKIMEIPAVIIINGKNVYYLSNATLQKDDPTEFITLLTQLTKKPK